MRRLLSILLAALTLLGTVLPSAAALAASLAQASAVPSGRAQLAHASPLPWRPLKQAPASTALEGTGEATQSGAETRGGINDSWDGELIEAWDKDNGTTQYQYDPVGQLLMIPPWDGRRKGGSYPDLAFEAATDATRHHMNTVNTAPGRPSGMNAVRIFDALGPLDSLALIRKEQP